MTILATELLKQQKKAAREHLELTFKAHLISVGLRNGWVCEYVFHPTRKWRFDFAWVDMKLAIEVDGGTTYGKSRHSKGDGFDNDCEKRNTAQAMGWTVFNFSSRMIKSGQAIMFVQDYFKGRECKAV